jgi:hypothetical protein
MHPMTKPAGPTDPTPPAPGSRPAPATGGEARRLERPPGERYRTGSPGRSDTAGEDPGGGARAGRRRALVMAVLAADAGAILFLVIALTGLDLGLLVVAAFAGWLTAIALVWRGRRAGIAEDRLRVAIGALLGGWAVVGGLLLDWVYALLTGGVLGPLEYVAQRYGIVAPLALALAAGVAAFRAR